MTNNADWLVPLGALAFMRDVGKHFSVNVMLAKDSVKSRLEEGISYTEFSYMLLQAYDFLELHRREGCTLQIGGSDQWGNITAGTELVRRSVGGEAHGVTLPLVTNADGKKFGKTESGNVWLDPVMTSPYRFFQFWINTDDRDAGRYLRYFTLLDPAAIEALEASIVERPEGREAQQELAMEVTTRVHGEDAARLARDVSRILFDRKADPRSLTPQALEMLSGEIPFRDVARNGEGTPQLSIVDALVETGLAKSKGDARRQVQQGGVSVNGRRLGSEELSVDAGEALHGVWFLIRKGGRDVGLIRG